MTPAEFEQLVEDARDVVGKMSVAQLAHMRQAQRVSWVKGELRLLHPEMTEAEADEHARRAAGPCPCDDCLLASVSQSRPTRPLNEETAAALADACREAE